jgi:hypothetical protein
MDDITEWLRQVHPVAQKALFGGLLCNEAADEIERLREACDLYRKNQIEDCAMITHLLGLLRDTVHPTQFAVIPLGWIERRDAALAVHGVVSYE